MATYAIKNLESSDIKLKFADETYVIVKPQGMFLWTSHEPNRILDVQNAIDQCDGNIDVWSIQILPDKEEPYDWLKEGF